ncbi:MAG: nitroreductase family protein [Burkholderiales bacterium]|jgi:nitroreductase|nr:nitroreductase family protein [Burkholderiales bacterium]MBW8891799.1 nitroreductase family protein [Burkholderiales bacterium]
MTHPALDLILQRTSINRFDPSHEIDDATLRELVRYAGEAPSAYNFQNWRFIAVRTPSQKARLCDMAYGQKKVVEASVIFIVCGRLQPHLGLRAALRPFMAAGHVDGATVDAMVDSATQGYADDPQMQRDEAIRSASLAAMTLMLAAQAMGLASGPMIGFDPAQVSAGFGLGADEVPVLLLTVGRPAPGNWPRKPRRPAADVLEIV